MMFRRAFATAIFVAAILVSQTADPLVLGSGRGHVTSSGDIAWRPMSAPSGAPVNTAQPQITALYGNPPPGASRPPIVGSLLKTTTGAWANSPTSYTYQWESNGVAVIGATHASYTVLSSDLNHVVDVVVTATNGSGSTPTSVSAGSVTDPVPVSRTLPFIAGTFVVGDTLTAYIGTWDNLPTGFSFQWRRNGSTISGATSQKYTLASDDNGAQISVDVTAISGGGQTTATSLQVGPIITPAVANCGGWGSSTFADGCAGAPAANDYTVQHPNFFMGYAQQSGQSYVTTGGCKGHANCHPPWAVAGVDYPVGPSCETSDCGFAQPSSATDPTNALSPNYHGNPAGCKSGAPARYIITCNETTSAAVDIGPFDFSWRGNCAMQANPCEGAGMGLFIGSGVTGPCTIHDSVFTYDIGVTYRWSGTAGYRISGCSSLTLKNDVFQVRDPKTGIVGVMWSGKVNGLQVWGGFGPRMSMPLGLNSPTKVEYTAFINCPSRCFAYGGGADFKYNYYEGINLYDATGIAAHGDGIITAFYNGPDGPLGQNICDCSGMDSISEKFDTWLLPNYGASGITCYTCAIVNLPSPVRVSAGVSKGSNILNVTAISGGVLYPAWGVYNGSGWAGYGSTLADGVPAPPPPTPLPVISACPGGAAGDRTACRGQAGAYTMNVPWTITCANPSAGGACGSSFTFTYPATVMNYDVENNVYIGNFVHATGAAAPTVPAGNVVGGAAQVIWSAYGNYKNITVKNNYVDMCGMGTGARNAGPPSYTCIPVVSGWSSVPPETSAVEGGNVMMTNGAYLSVFKAQNSSRRRSQKRPPASLPPAPTGPQEPGPPPQPRRH
jgi:hypothetical protein